MDAIIPQKAEAKRMKAGDLKPGDILELPSGFWLITTESESEGSLSWLTCVELSSGKVDRVGVDLPIGPQKDFVLTTRDNCIQKEAK